MRVFGFMRDEIAIGRQIYVVYPLFEESVKLDLNNLEQGYEALSREFPRPQYQISIVHIRYIKSQRNEEDLPLGRRSLQVSTTYSAPGRRGPSDPTQPRRELRSPTLLLQERVH